LCCVGREGWILPPSRGDEGRPATSSAESRIEEGSSHFDPSRASGLLLRKP
jgi:hypothetical protein